MSMGGLLPSPMVESVAEVLVKEERRPEMIPIAFPPPVYLQRLPATSMFLCFYLRLRPS
jgi:hypothetical protein